PSKPRTTLGAHRHSLQIVSAREASVVLGGVETLENVDQRLLQISPSGVVQRLKRHQIELIENHRLLHLERGAARPREALPMATEPVSMNPFAFAWAGAMGELELLL
ncbi:MAG: hypothetical protein ACR2HD_11225, partial [Solirubrobacteraceae bacterium]